MSARWTRARQELSQSHNAALRRPLRARFVRPTQTVTFEFKANNRRQWLTQCQYVSRDVMGVVSYARGNRYRGYWRCRTALAATRASEVC